MVKKPKTKKIHGNTKKNVGGRPRVEISAERVFSLARFMATDEEIAAGLNVSIATWRNYKKNDPKLFAAMERGRQKFCGSLRKKQIAVAMKGNVIMLKWLGQQYLGQKEKALHGSDPENPLPDGEVQPYSFATATEAAAAFEAKLKERNKGT